MRGVALCSLWAEEGLDLSICVEDESQRQRTMAHALSSFFFFCANAPGEACIRRLCHLQVCLLSVFRSLILHPLRTRACART